MRVQRGRIAFKRAQRQRSRALEIILTERFVGLFEQTLGLSEESSGRSQQEQESDHVTVTRTTCR
jgi:hypothetical protein